MPPLLPMPSTSSTAWPRSHRSPGLIALLCAASRGRADVPLQAFHDGVVRWAVETGLGPLLAHTTAQDPGALASSLWPMVQGADLTARVLTAQQLDAMAEILDACTGRVPPLVLLKGVSICEQHYPEPHLRPMRDLDVLIEADGVHVVEAVLSTLGYRQRFDRPPAFYEGHHHGGPFVHPRTGVWVEIHRALVAAHSELSADAVFAPETVRTELRPSDFRGRPVRRLSDELQIIYVACHWAHGLRAVGGMVAMADMTFLLRSAPVVDWERILWWADGSVAARDLYVLLTYLDRHGLVDLPPGVLDRLGARQALGRIPLAIAHALIERYVASARDFGLVMSERNFIRLWRLVVGQRPRRRGGRQPSGPARCQAPQRAVEPKEEVSTTMTGDGSAGTLAWPGLEPAPPPAASLYPARRADVRARVVAGEAIVLDRERQLVHQLNQTASYIWERCDGRHSVTDIASALAEAFDIEVETAERDVVATVRQLEVVGLVDVRTETAAPSAPSARR